MKIVYCLIDSSSPGGMERSICVKANYLADVMGYDVTIVTTDRRGKPNFYDYSKKINFIDLGINYCELQFFSFFKRLNRQLKKRNIHRKKLENLLMNLKPDVSISTYTHELSILYKIKDGSKKIAESHLERFFFNKGFSSTAKISLKYGFAFFAEKNKQRLVKRYDAFVVLTDKEKEFWKNTNSVYVIPNALPFYSKEGVNNEAKHIISVGRLTYMKGYTYLINAWEKVRIKHPDWKLSIFGDGEYKTVLYRLINEKRLSSVITIHSSVPDIEKEYMNSSIFVTASLSESFGLVLVEAMACGLPCIAFSNEGSSEILEDGKTGLIIEPVNIDKLADAVIFLIEDKCKRKKMGADARKSVIRFSPEVVMPQWISLFKNITGNRNIPLN